MIKKRIKKIICFLSVFVIAFSCFIINSSALTPSEPIKFSISQPSTGSGDGYLEILSKDSSGNYFARVFTWHIDFNEYHSYDSDIIPTFDDIAMLVTVKPSSIELQFPYISSYWNARAYVYTIGTSGTVSYGDFDTSSNGKFVHNFAPYTIISAHVYGNGFFSVNSYSSCLAVEPFYCIYSGDSVEHEQLRNVISIINQLAQNDQTIISKLQTIINNTDTIETKLQSAIDLLKTIETDLDDVNAELDRIESNTDDLEKQLNTIIDILDNENQQTPKPDNSTTDDYAAKEEQLMGGTAAGREEANTVFTDVNTTLSDNVGRGLLAVSAIFKEFIDITWLSSLLKFSLALGMFSFILGMAFFLVSSSASKEARSNAKETNKLRSDYYKNRSDK